MTIGVLFRRWFKIDGQATGLDGLRSSYQGNPSILPEGQLCEPLAQNPDEGKGESQPKRWVPSPPPFFILDAWFWGSTTVVSTGFDCDITSPGWFGSSRFKQLVQRPTLPTHSLVRQNGSFLELEASRFRSLMLFTLD